MNSLTQNQPTPQNENENEQRGFFWSGEFSMVCLNAVRKAELTHVTLAKGNHLSWLPVMFIHI